MKIGDEKLEFELEETDRELIIQYIAEKTNLTIEEIETYMEFEEEDENEEGKTIHVEIKEELGICAGLILLSKNAEDRIVGNTDQPLLDLLDVKVERNSFGRQRDSFEAKVSLEPLNISSFHGVFIRAPSISDVGSDVEVLSKFNEKIVAVKQGNIIATSFHPELTTDISLHKYFVKIIQQSFEKNN